MLSLHYLWPLFTPDVLHGRETLKEMWRKKQIDTNQAAHWGLNLGDNEWVRSLLENEIEDESKVKGIKFRLERVRDRENPYTTLIELSRNEEKEARNRGLNGWIELTGGIGDHLEDLNILMPWLKEQGGTIKISCEANRKKQLETIFPEFSWCAKESKKKNNRTVKSKVLMAALKKNLPKPVGLIELDKVRIKKSEKSIFCCWKAAGKGDKLSRWIRSIPFTDVSNFYDIMIKSGQLASSITDCSHWKPWEIEVLKNKGIEIYKPEEGDVLELAKKVNKHRIVISIDTALVHLCAAIRKDVTLLLPKYHDERWNQHITSGSCYYLNCRIRKQLEYGKWSGEMKKLAEEVKRFNL